MASLLAPLQTHRLPFPGCRSHASSSGNKSSLNKESQCRTRPVTQNTQIPLSFLSSFSFFSLPSPSSSSSSSLALEISFLSNTNFKRRLSSSGSQINFTPYCNMKTSSARIYTPTHACMDSNTHLTAQERHGIRVPSSNTHQK